MSARLGRLLLLACLVGPSSARADDFRIRFVRQEGRELRVYHDDWGAADRATVEVGLGGCACAPIPEGLRRPDRGGDALTTVFVIDRGGTAGSGMGRHSSAILAALGVFLQGAMAGPSLDEVAIIDSPGRDIEPSSMAATRRYEDVRSYLEGLPAPSGSGANVYGVATLGLAMLDRAATRLGVLVIISDGVDPALESGAGTLDDDTRLIEEARRRGVPVVALHIGRRGDLKGDDDTRLTNGRARLLNVTNETNGELTTVPADPQLEARLTAQLEALQLRLKRVSRTSCRLCGDVGGGRVVVEMVVKGQDGEVGRSIGFPAPLWSMNPARYPACEEGAASPGAASCLADADCNERDKCQGGVCVRRRTARDLVPWAGGGMVLLGLLLLVWQRRAGRLPAPSTEVQTSRPNTRLPGSSAPASVAPSSEARGPGVRLSAQPGSGEAFDVTLGVGAHLIGAAPDTDVRLMNDTVSGHHAQLHVEEARVTVMDLASSNGTFVNGARLPARHPTELRTGDILSLSRTVVLVVERVQPQPSRRGVSARTRLEE
jgi:hypothetical protein